MCARNISDAALQLETKLRAKYFDDCFFVPVIFFQEKMTNTCWFQHPKLFLFIYLFQIVIFLYEASTKEGNFEMSLWVLGNCDEHFLPFFLLHLTD